MAVNKHRVRSHGGDVVTDGLAIVSFTLVMWTMCKDIHSEGESFACVAASIATRFSVDFFRLVPCIES